MTGLYPASDGARPTEDGDAPVVDLYADPACVYTWIVSQWLFEVERQQPIDLRFHVMSLLVLNEGHDVGRSYRATVERTTGPARVATAVAEQFGEARLREFYTALGEELVEHWPYPPATKVLSAATATALRRTGLPAELAATADTADYDEALRRSHDAGVGPVGPEAGSPILHIDGAACFGPVLHSIPRGRDAVRIFEATRSLTAFPGFYELKRTRFTLPVLT